MNQKNIAKPTKDATSPSPSPVQSSPRNSSLHTRLYKGSIDCGIQVNRKLQCDQLPPILPLKLTTLALIYFQTVRNEGFAALYKGFIPTWFRMGPWNIIFFITYEQLKQFY